MMVTDVLIQTQPGCAPAVEALLERQLPGFQGRRVEGDCIVASWCAPTGQAQALAEILQSMDPDIISVNPTVLGVIGD
jgi:hypothetical protein